MNTNRLIIICFLSLIGVVTSNAHPGVGIVKDSKGNVYYTDLNHVWQIAPDGTRSIAIKNVHTHELYIDEQDNLYGEHEWYKGEATDKWGNYVWCLSEEGVLEKTIPDIEGFLENNTLVRDTENNYYWVKNSGAYQILNRQTPDGKSVPFTTQKFTDIRWLYFSKADKYLYVVDNLQIKKVGSSGQVMVIADNLKEDQPSFEGVADRHYISGLWTDKKSNIYIAVYGASKIIQITPEGQIKTIFESEKGWSPCGGMIAPDGTQWIMEYSKNNTTRVRKITEDGKHIVFGG